MVFAELYKAFITINSSGFFINLENIILILIVEIDFLEVIQFSVARTFAQRAFWK